MPERLPRRFYERDVVTVARALLGQRLVRMINGKRLTGIIVETEAYLGIPDKAAHTYGGRRTPRNESMWQQAGTLYVYFTYGMHHCCNVTAGSPGQPVAALIRAVEPVEGIDTMKKNRSSKRKISCHTALCSGPAKLTQAFGIDRHADGSNLVTDKSIHIEKVRSRSLPSKQIITTPRIGIQYAEDWVDRPLRFYVKDNPHISKK